MGGEHGCKGDVKRMTEGHRRRGVGAGGNRRGQWRQKRWGMGSKKISMQSSTLTYPGLS